MSTRPRPRLTPHQAEVYGRIHRRAGRGLVTTDEQIGSAGAVQHLVEKGYITRTLHRTGPRGGETYRLELTEAAG